ncbi:MAG: Asp23/Gls24 family envelope stress response protein [Jatrophihabitantaceae bacterium]
MTGPAEPAVVDGIDVDAVAAAVRGCPAVDDLDGGRLDAVATYLPGRRVPGIRIVDDRIEVHVRGVWDQPVSLIARQVQGVLAPLTGGRIIDVVLTDVAEPGHARARLESGAAGTSDGVTPSALADGTVEEWTRTSASDAPSGGSSSAATIQTAAEIRPNS